MFLTLIIRNFRCWDWWEATAWFEAGKAHDVIYVLKNYYGSSLGDDLENAGMGTRAEPER